MCYQDHVSSQVYQFVSEFHPRHTFAGQISDSRAHCTRSAGFLPVLDVDILMGHMVVAVAEDLLETALEACLLLDVGVAALAIPFVMAFCWRWRWSMSFRLGASFGLTVRRAG